MLRAIREIKPRWIIGENVYGLVNWSEGLVFDEVQSELEAEGFEVFPYVLPAASVNAPHKRDRVWFVAHASSNGYDDKSATQNNGIRQDNQQSRTQWERTAERFSDEWDASDSLQIRLQQCEDGTEVGGRQEEICRQRSESSDGVETDGEIRNAANTTNKGLERSAGKSKRRNNIGFASNYKQTSWENFPTVSPIRMRDDGVSDKLLRFVVKQFYDTISYTSQENRIENLQEVWERVQSKEIWEQIRGLYSLESKIVLFQTMQLYSSEWSKQGELSPFSEEFCKPILQHLSKYKEFRCSPQGQELEKQRHVKFGNTLSFLPHEVALAARRFEAAIEKFEAWHRNESIKAGGNAVVPQVVYQLFKTIEVYEQYDRRTETKTED